MEESLWKERSLLRIPAGIPGQLTMLVFLSLVFILPFLSSPAALITSWRGTWNTLAVVDLAEALACGTGSASDDGTPWPWEALWRACICQDGNALENQRMPWKARALVPTLQVSAHGTWGVVTCQPPFMEHALGPWASNPILDLPLPPSGQLPPHWLCPEGVWAGGEAGAFPADPVCPSRAWGVISDSVWVSSASRTRQIHLHSSNFHRGSATRTLLSRLPTDDRDFLLLLISGTSLPTLVFSSPAEAVASLWPFSVDSWVLVVPGCPLMSSQLWKEAWPAFPNPQMLPFHRWGLWSLEGRSDFFGVTRLVRSWARTQPKLLPFLHLLLEDLTSLSFCLPNSENKASRNCLAASFAEWECLLRASRPQTMGHPHQVDPPCWPSPGGLGSCWKRAPDMPSSGPSGAGSSLQTRLHGVSWEAGLCVSSGRGLGVPGKRLRS